jgi:hypothetical protein
MGGSGLTVAGSLTRGLHEIILRAEFPFDFLNRNSSELVIWCNNVLVRAS